MTITGPRRTDAPRLERRIGLTAAAFSGIGIVLGAGIYVLVGEAAGEAGSGVWIAFALAALLAAGTGLSFAELSSMFPEAGASSAYAREAFGPHVGFVTGWMAITVSVIGAAAVAIGFGGYLSDLFTGDQTVIAAFVLLGCAAIVYLGVRETVTVAIVFALLEATGLLMVVVVGLPDVGTFDVFEVRGGLGGLLAATALVFFAYEGFEEIATLSEETRNPTRNIPLAIVIAVVATSVLYVAVSLVAISVVPWEQLAASDAPLATVVDAAASERLGDLLSTIALFATFNTVLLLLATGARLVYGMSSRRLLPAVLGQVSAARGTPWVATAAVTAIALVFALTGDIGFVAQVTNFAVFALFLSVNASVVRLRFTQPERRRPFRLPGAIAGVPVLPAVAGAGTVALATFMDRDAVLTGVVALALGIALSVVTVRHEQGTER